jgi:outer membrane lipoprotein-sorting protein
MLLIGMSCLLLVGCGKDNEKEVLKKLNKTIDDTKGYHLTGEMAITNNEEVYKYAVDVAYAKENKFRVSLKNKLIIMNK